MKNTMNIESYPVLMDWIGDTQDDSYLDADLESLKDVLPTLVKAKINSGKDEQDLLEKAIVCVSLTIANLRDVHDAVSVLWKGGES